MACLGDSGYKQGEAIRANGVATAANITRVGAIAIAILNASDLIDNYNKQRSISDRALKISESEQNHLKQVYWPRELQFLNEFGTPENIETAEALGRRYAGRLVSSVAGTFARQIAADKCNASRYCTSARAKSTQDLLLARAQAIANARILGRMIGFTEVQARTDKNFKRRLQAAALGKNLMQEAAALYGDALKGVAASGADIAGRLSGALQRLGFADRDPGPSTEMQNLWNARQQQLAGMPYDPSGAQYHSSYTLDPSISGLSDPTTDLMSIDGSQVSTSGVNAGLHNFNMHGNSSYFRNLQHERHNEADVGNRDLARVGEKTYTFTDSRGDRGEITVKMSDFVFDYVDDKKPGDS